MRLRTIMVISVIAAFAVFFGLTNKSTAESSLEPILMQQELRAGYGLYNERAYVERIASDTSAHTLAADHLLPIPITTNELDLLYRNTELSTELGAWIDNEQRNNGKVFRSAHFGAASSPNAEPTVTVYATNSAAQSEDLKSASWPENTRVKIVQVSHSWDEARKAIHTMDDPIARKDLESFSGEISTLSDDPESDGLALGVSDPSVVTEFERKQIVDLLGMDVRIIQRDTPVPTYSIPAAYVQLYNHVGAGTWNTFRMGAAAGLCTSNLVVQNYEAPYTKRWVTTAQHCASPLLNAYDGSDAASGFEVYQSSTHRLNTTDHQDVSFYQIPANRASSEMYLFYSNGNRALRTIIGTANPAYGTTYCFTGWSTKSNLGGARCGTVSSGYSYYLTINSETMYGYYMNIQECEGDSGAPVYSTPAAGQARVVGVMSATDVPPGSQCGTNTYFASVIPAMQQFGMAAY